VLGWVYERACDQPYADIASEYLWAPLGAERDAYITVDARDAMRAAGGICVAPRRSQRRSISIACAAGGVALMRLRSLSCKCGAFSPCRKAGAVPIHGVHLAL
jgi:CubicO group peptidase (beta-lactamase class C family)